MKPLLSFAVWMMFAASVACAQDLTDAPPALFPNTDAPDELPKVKEHEAVELPDAMRSVTEIGYAITTRYVKIDGSASTLMSRATHLPLTQALNPPPHTTFSPARHNGKPIACWIQSATIFNPKSAAKNATDATPRLLSVVPAVRPRGDKGSLDPVRVELALDEKGEITNATPQSEIAADRLELVRAALKSWRFAPARQAGRAVASTVVVPVLFVSAASAGVEKSIGPKLISDHRPTYPAAMERYGITGLVTVQFDVDEHGNVVDPTIYSSSNPGFDDAAVDAILQWRYQPGTRDGTPIRQHLRQEVHFVSPYGSHEVFKIDAKNAAKLPPELQYDTPAKIQSLQLPVYPFPELRDGITGHAEIAFLVGPDGRVQDVNVIAASHPDFGLSLTAAIQGFVFTPAFKAGKPVPFLLKFRQPFTRLELPDDATDAVLAIEKNHPDRIVPGNKLDAPLTPVSRSKPLFPVTVASTVTTGKAVIECLVDQKGHARLPRVVSATEPAFGYAAAQAANTWWFVPPKQDGRPVVTRVRIPFAFSREPEPPAATPPVVDRN